MGDILGGSQAQVVNACTLLLIVDANGNDYATGISVISGTQAQIVNQISIILPVDENGDDNSV